MLRKSSTSSRNTATDSLDVHRVNVFTVPMLFVPGREKIMLKGIEKGINQLTRFSGLVSGMTLFALMVINTYAVIRRHVFNSPLDWVLDVSELLMVAAVFLGTAYLLHINGHVRVDLVVNILPRKWVRVVSIATTLCVLLFCIVLVWKSGELAWMNRGTRSDSVVMFPLFPGYFMVFYGSCLLLFQSIMRVRSAVKGPDSVSDT